MTLSLNSAIDDQCHSIQAATIELLAHLAAYRPAADLVPRASTRALDDSASPPVCYPVHPANLSRLQTERLERVLFALKERIPIKLKKEREAGKKKGAGKEKTQVDVYRGGTSSRASSCAVR